MHKIKFIEDSHRYINEEGDDLISVSKFTERFKEKQNWDEIAKKCAAKETKNGNPTTKADILKKWANKRDRSSEIGTLFHSLREQELINEIEPSFYEFKCSKKMSHNDTDYKYSIPIEELENNTVYPEMMIYDMDHMICGQSDKVIVVNDTIHIWDYKTDAEIAFKGWSSQWKKATKLLGPLSHLDDCSANVYSIKMSLYMYMLWKANKGRFKTGEIVIEHVHLKRDPDNDNIPVLEDGKPVILGIEEIRLPYRKKEVMAMLATIKTKQYGNEI